MRFEKERRGKNESDFFVPNAARCGAHVMQCTVRAFWCMCTHAVAGKKVQRPKDSLASLATAAAALKPPIQRRIEVRKPIKAYFLPLFNPQIMQTVYVKSSYLFVCHVQTTRETEGVFYDFLWLNLRQQYASIIIDPNLWRPRKNALFFVNAA